MKNGVHIEVKDRLIRLLEITVKSGVHPREL